MNDMPTHALSVRQPWAWAIIHGGKDVENRDWRTQSRDLLFRGRVALHASGGLKREEYENAAAFMAGLGVTCPAPADLYRGGIIGSVEICDVVKSFPSKWFAGPNGLLLRKARGCDFIPAKGALGFFEWRPCDPADVPETARWMKPVTVLEATPSTGDLFGGGA